MKGDWLQKNISALLALATTGGIFVLFVLAFFIQVHEGNREVLFMVIGALATTLATVIGYYFGSSAGSARKNELLKDWEDREKEEARRN